MNKMDQYDRGLRAAQRERRFNGGPSIVREPEYLLTKPYEGTDDQLLAAWAHVPTDDVQYGLAIRQRVLRLRREREWRSREASQC